MRRPFRLLSLCCLLAVTLSAQAATGRIIKVLPQLLDRQGRNSLSPSLYERDAYQAYLRQHPDGISGMRFNVQWKGRGRNAGPLKLRVEFRGLPQGDVPRALSLEQGVSPTGWFGRWTALTLSGDEYKKIGAVTAWRVTLWEGDQLLGGQQSFLW